LFENQLSRLAKVQIPVVMAVIVLVSTIVHHLTTPIPSSMPILSFLSYDILVAVLIAPLLYHCLKTIGTVQGLLFFFTVSFFMGSLEALWVFLGKLGILGDAYNYPMGGLWFFGIPLYIAVAWFIWVYVLYILVRKLLTGAPLWKACLCGLMALCIDIWMDPSVVNSSLVSNSPNIWDWTQTNAPKLLTVPLYNFIGWFLSVATMVFVYEITWARIRTISQKARPFREICARLAGGWIIFVVGTKALQIGLEHLLPGLNLCTLGLKTGGTMTVVKTAMLFAVPSLIAACLVIAVLRAIYDKESRKDIWLVLGFAASVAVNLQTAYTLQMAFPGTYLIYLVVFPMLLPFMMMIWYLTRPSQRIVRADKSTTA
jgi:hypothetical protein